MALSVDRINGVSGDLAIKTPVRVATTANITLEGLQTIDGVALAADDRVLVKNQTTTASNGIWIANTSAWSRALDFDGRFDVVQGTMIPVVLGTTNAGSAFKLDTASPVIGTSSLSFSVANDFALRADLASTASGKGAALVGVPDTVAPTYLKTISDVINGDPVSLLRFIPPAQHSAIRARTTTYDATADLTTALNVTSNAATPQIELVMPSGLILCTGNIAAGRNITLKGQGWRSKIRVANGANPTSIITFGDEANVTTVEIHDLEFDGNKANNPTGVDGLAIVRPYKANCFNVRVIDCVGDGFQYQATGTGFENHLYNCSSYNNDGYGVRMTGAGLTDTRVVGGDFGFNATGGIVLATSCTVQGATVWGGGQANSRGIVTAGLSWQIVGNRIEGHGQHGIYVQSGNDYGHIADNKIYANSFTAANDGLYDGIHIEANAGYGTVVGNKIYSAVSAVSNYSMRYAINFAGAHNQWTIEGNDLPLLVAGSPASFKTAGAVVNGVLDTDKCDFNWIRTNLLTQRTTNFNPAAGVWTAFPFDNDVADQLSEFSAGTFTPKNSGRYRIECGFTFTAAAANENIGLALYTNAGVAVRRLDFKRSEGVNSEMVSGVIEEFLTAGTAYDIRYFAGSAASTFLAGAEFTYLKIRAAHN